MTAQIKLRFVSFAACMALVTQMGMMGGCPPPPPPTSMAIAVTPPVVEANERETVTLNGAASLPANAQFKWSQLSGPAVQILNDTQAVAEFIAPSVDQDTVLTIRLTVSSTGDVDSVDTEVRVKEISPIARAGPDQTVNEGLAITLSATASTGRNITFLWSQVGGPAVQIPGSVQDTITFDAPAVSADQTLEFKLEVTDDRGERAADMISVTVKNVLPVARAGMDQTVMGDTLVTLDGGASTGPGAIAYAWQQIGGPGVTLSDIASPAPTFQSPMVTGDITLNFRLTITNSATETASDDVVVTVSNVAPPPQLPPVARAGDDRVATEGTTVELNGAASSGDALTFEWSQTAGPAVVLQNASTAIANLVAPPVDTNTPLTFQLKVTDRSGRSATDALAVIVRDQAAPPPPAAPVANAGTDQNVPEGTAMQLSGAGSTGDGITYAWQQTAGPQVNLQDATTMTASFNAPDVTADTGLNFTLTITDSLGRAATDAVVVTVRDMAAPPPQPGTPTELDYVVLLCNIQFLMDQYAADVIDLLRISQEQIANQTGAGSFTGTGQFSGGGFSFNPNPTDRLVLLNTRLGNLEFGIQRFEGDYSVGRTSFSLTHNVDVVMRPIGAIDTLRIVSVAAQTQDLNGSDFQTQTVGTITGAMLNFLLNANELVDLPMLVQTNIVSSTRPLGNPDDDHDLTQESMAGEIRIGSDLIRIDRRKRREQFGSASDVQWIDASTGTRGAAAYAHQNVFLRKDIGAFPGSGQYVAQGQLVRDNQILGQLQFQSQPPVFSTPTIMVFADSSAILMRFR